MAKKLLAIFLVFATLISCMCLPASAATCSWGTRTQTITVHTKGCWWYPGSESITISQSKGCFSYTNWQGQNATKKAYGGWNISYYATDGSHSGTKYLSGSSVKINLKPDKTYTITISYDFNNDTFEAVSHKNFRWQTYPSWQVSSTWKVSSYY